MPHSRRSDAVMHAKRKKNLQLVDGSINISIQCS